MNRDETCGLIDEILKGWQQGQILDEAFAETMGGTSLTTEPPIHNKEIKPVITPEIPETIRKAKLTSDLYAVWCNNEVKSVLTKQPNGEAVWDVFTQAIQKEIETIMTGQGPSIVEISEKIRLTANETQEIYEKIKAMSNSPLLSTLNLLLDRLGGSTPEIRQKEVPAPMPRKPIGYSDPEYDLEGLP